jgi:2-amino-4-hydroxy-6-hydroxymethyldihydropteridine diphosphokinase
LAEFRTAAIAIGSNLGDRAGHIVAAVTALAGLPKSRLIARSTVRETAAVGLPGHDAGGPYLNAVVLLSTKLAAPALLAALHEIEHSRGRDRAAEPARWMPRTLDLDLLLLGDEVVREPGLTIPHPRLHQRRFVLEPLAEVAPDWVVPGLNASVSSLLASCVL